MPRCGPLQRFHSIASWKRQRIIKLPIDVPLTVLYKARNMHIPHSGPNVQNVLAPHRHKFAPLITRTNRNDCRVHVDAAAVLFCGFPGGELSKWLWCPEPPWCEWPIKVCWGTAASASTVLAKVPAHAAPNVRTVHELLNDHPKVRLAEANIGSAQVQDIQCAGKLDGVGLGRDHSQGQT